MTKPATTVEPMTYAKVIGGLPPIAVICGSTRFMQVMTGADRTLTWAGWIVLKPGCDMKTPHPLWADPDDAEAGKQRLDDLHRAKIRLADEVYVLCPGRYIGDSTRREIAYAQSLGKPIKYVTDGNLTPLPGTAP